MDLVGPGALANVKKSTGTFAQGWLANCLMLASPSPKPNVEFTFRVWTNPLNERVRSVTAHGAPTVTDREMLPTAHPPSRPSGLQRCATTRQHTTGSSNRQSALVPPPQRSPQGNFSPPGNVSAPADLKLEGTNLGLGMLVHPPLTVQIPCRLLLCRFTTNETEHGALFVCLSGARGGWTLTEKDNN